MGERVRRENVLAKIDLLKTLPILQVRERCLPVPTLRNEPPRESDPLARLFELGVAPLDRGGTVGDVEAIGVGLDSALDQCVELAAARLVDGHVSPEREISAGGRQDAGAGRGRGILGTGETAVKDGSARHGTRALRGQAVGPGPPRTRVKLWERYVPPARSIPFSGGISWRCAPAPRQERGPPARPRALGPARRGAPARGGGGKSGRSGGGRFGAGGGDCVLRVRREETL